MIKLINKTRVIANDDTMTYCVLHDCKTIEDFVTELLKDYTKNWSIIIDEYDFCFASCDCENGIITKNQIKEHYKLKPGNIQAVEQNGKITYFLNIHKETEYVR